MQKRRLWQHIKIVLLATLMATTGHVGVATAITSSSSHYQATETQFGTGALNACSASFCAQASIGDMAAGDSKSATTTAKFGTIQDDEPLLEVIVDPGQSNLGVLSTDQTASKTTTVRVRNHLSGGYMLQIIGDPPKYSGHSLKTPNTPTASQAGTEQFGINLTTNSVPSVGANPLQVPSEQTSFGAATDDYKITNRFMYKSGDVVARSTTESGRTDYTISMIVNVSGNTPAGHYAGDYAAVVIPVY